MKKNRTMRVATLLLALTLITSCFVGGTFAKYTSSTNAKATATVAKWSILVDGEDIATSNQAAIIDMFSTILDSNDETETDVKMDMIAPGTKGSYEIVVENASEVTANVSIDFQYDSALPLTVTFKEKDASAAYDGGDIRMEAGENKTIVVEWEWPFEAVSPRTDADDTALGTAEVASEFTVTAAITATQVD